MKALFAPLALSLALAAGSASADPLPLTFINDQIQAGEDMYVLNDVRPFTLGVATVLSGTINTFSTVAGFDPYVDITDAYLTQVGVAGRVDLVETVGTDGFGVETWTLFGQPLAAGDWYLHVVGYDINDKRAEGYIGVFDGVPVQQVPEPASLALAGLALAAAGLSRRRKR